MIYSFFTFVFYLFLIPSIFFEINCVRTPAFILAKAERLESSDPKRIKSHSDVYFILFSTFYAIWGLIGLVSSQWFLFAVLTILSFNSAIIRKYFKHWFVKWLQFDAIITLIILLLIVLNKCFYHYHLVFN